VATFRSWGGLASRACSTLGYRRGLAGDEVYGVVGPRTVRSVPPDRTRVGNSFANFVNAVRAELGAAAVKARDQQLQCAVQDVQLGVEVTTTDTREVDGGMKVWVLTIDGKGSRANAAARKVTLNLSPVTAEGTKFRVSDVSARPNSTKL
jgi:Trypsin-co-occurring domain 2